MTRVGELEAQLAAEQMRVADLEAQLEQLQDLRLGGWQQEEQEEEPVPQQEPEQPEQPVPQPTEEEDLEFRAGVLEANMGTHWQEVFTVEYLSQTVVPMMKTVPGLAEVDPRFTLDFPTTYTLHELLAAQDPAVPYLDAYKAACVEAKGVLPPLPGESVWRRCGRGVAAVCLCAPYYWP